MYSCKSLQKILTLIVFTLFLSMSSSSVAAVAIPDVDASDAAGVAKVKEGMTLFKANCAACHALDKKLIGPGLTGVWDNWESEAKLVEWVHNSTKVIESGHAHANKIFAEFNKMIMPGFPQLSPEQVMDIFTYVKNPTAAEPPKTAAAQGAPGDGIGAGPAAGKSSTWYVWALVTFMAVLSILLWSITSKLDRAVREKAGEVVGDEDVFSKLLSKKTLKVILLIGSILLVFNIFNGAIDLGRSQGYAPEQPIRFSHALHVGQNQIECQYCHTGVEKSRHASIPGTQICMN